MSSVFFCDSDCELWYTYLDELGIKLIGMPYIIDGVSQDYDMGRNTDFKKFYDKIRKGSIPTTAALNEQNYIDYFEPVLKNGQDILYVHFSNKLSGTFAYMDKAIIDLKMKYPERKITTVDTLGICTLAGVIVYEAALMWKNGKSDEEVAKWVEENRQHFAAYFVVDDLNHLKRGGRISATTAIFGSILSIKPLLYISEEGKVEKCGVAQGFKKGIVQLVNYMKEKGENVADYPISIVDADNKESADYLESLIKDYVGEDAVIWRQPVGPVIGTHCGPGTIGLIFHCSKR
jgi:DegV family protein with EDD domain